jgi:hypothetical protein
MHWARTSDTGNFNKRMIIPPINFFSGNLKTVSKDSRLWFQIAWYGHPHAAGTGCYVVTGKPSLPFFIERAVSSKTNGWAGCCTLKSNSDSVFRVSAHFV